MPKAVHERRVGRGNGRLRVVLAHCIKTKVGSKWAAANDSRLGFA